MRMVLIFGLLASASAFVEVPTSYHDEIGIPAAERIKAYEDAIVANPEASGASVYAGRIVGGVVAPAHAHPYLGGLIISFVNIAGNSVCGSSLLSPNRLVTAAHCWFDGRRQAWQFVVVLGSQFVFHGGTRVATSNVVMHPQYVPSMLFNDIAMIYLPTRVSYSSTIQPINLPAPWEITDTFAGTTATASGYGITSDQQVGVSVNTMVSHVRLQVITNAQCQQTYPSHTIASTLCTSGQGGVGVCGGDSGGPLVLDRFGRQILIGVTSFAAQINGVQVCQWGFPSGFARVTSFYSFITQHL